jgi:hypothetical protein
MKGKRDIIGYVPNISYTSCFPGPHDMVWMPFDTPDKRVSSENGQVAALNVGLTTPGFEPGTHIQQYRLPQRLFAGRQILKIIGMFLFDSGI